MGPDYQSHIERQLVLEAIISRIAKDFVRSGNIDEGIINALEALGTFSNADRAYVFLFQDNLLLMDNTHEWCKDNVAPAIGVLQNLEISTFPWWMEQIGDGNLLNIQDVNQLGPEAAAEKEILKMQGIQSALVLPIMLHNTLKGFVGFDNTHSSSIWTDDDHSALTIASELFSSVFERFFTEKQLTSTNNELSEALCTLKATQSQLVQQEQMVAIGQLAAGVAHEINNPLGFIISNHKTLSGHIDYLLSLCSIHVLSSVSTNDKNHIDFIKDDLPSILEDIDIGLQRVRKIIDSLRFFSRIDNYNTFDLYNIKEGIQNTLVVINSRVRYATELSLDIEDNLPSIEANGGKINQVILNLILNAIDAIEERHPDKGGLLRVIAKDYDDHIKLCIEDNGKGIPEDVLPHIFVPFYTTKPIGKGTGLGLSIVYDIIVNLHKGVIQVDSVENAGTSITITLPKFEKQDSLGPSF